MRVDFRALDRQVEQSKLLNALEGIGDKLPQIRSPDNDPAVANWLRGVGRWAAELAGFPAHIGLAVAEILIRAAPDDHRLERAAKATACGWAACLDKVGMILTADRVRRKNCS